MSKEQGITLRYSISFKQKVVREIEEEGLSMTEAARRYGIKGGQTIHRWVKTLGKNHLLNKIVRIEMKDEKDRTRELEKEVKKLKQALADAYLACDCAEEVIKQAGKIYGEDLKKKFGESASVRLGKDTH